MLDDPGEAAVAGGGGEAAEDDGELLAGGRVRPLREMTYTLFVNKVQFLSREGRTSTVTSAYSMLAACV